MQLHPLLTDKMSQPHSQVHNRMYWLLHRHQRKPQYLDQAGCHAAKSGAHLHQMRWAALQAEADTTWYESEQLRREAAEKALQEEKDAAARLQKQVLYDVRRGAALREKDAQLLERRCV